LAFDGDAARAELYIVARGGALRRIERLAEISVARGCGFAGLAIFTFMVGLLGYPKLAFQSGGILTLIACLVLLGRGLQAPSRPYNRTEVWIMLEPGDRPRSVTAQKVIGVALREVYLRFALYAACLSVLLLFASALVDVIELRP
jgi:hypothetical protein